MVGLQEFLPALLHHRGVVHRIKQGIALVDEIHALTGKIGDFKREDNEEFVHISLDFLHSALPGGPDLGCNVVEYPESLLVGKFCNAEIEARKVYENHGVRLPLQNVCETAFEPAGIGSGLEKDLYETDHSPVLVVLDKSFAALIGLVNLVHEIASPESDIGLRIAGIKALHQIGAVKVTGSFARYDIVFH